MRQPTESDLEAAREYLLQRLDAEYAMSYQLESLMREAANEVVEILYTANITPTIASYGDLPIRVQWDIDEVAQRLQEAIDDYFQTYAVADRDGTRHLILPFILAENHGATFGERLSDYVGKYKDELLLLVGAGLLLGVEKSALQRSIGDNLRRPYANPLLRDGIDAPITYGRGRSNSMFNSLHALTKFGIGQAWMYHRHLMATEEDARGFITFRNSTCPCDLCDEYTTYIHPMEDPTPPLHNSCVCGTLYVDAKGNYIDF